MKELNDEERRKVLRFVTSVSRPPLLGFGALKPRFSIRDAGDDQQRLCSASEFLFCPDAIRYVVADVGLS
jgi:ubiquitin-protein ligase E3 C